ncbi:MAG: protein kinase [Gemmatimonadales bacterium]|nr:protein kinase [Gemmatimonadales bacterium]
MSDRYRLDRELGRGGMACVFLAHDLRHDRPVALKVLHPELAALLGPERFQREIKLAARLQHPHILTVHDSGETDGQLWFTMPFVEGESLRERLGRETQLSVDDALRIATDAARALDYAHQHGVVHRDIKPENLLLTTDGSTLVADFGIARSLSGADDHLTQTGTSVGTPAYMSPEQAAGQRDLDGRSDIYSLACVLYEMLAGEPPYTGASAQVILAKRVSGPVPLVRRVRPAVPEALEQAVATALAPVAADRFATAAEFGRVLASAASAVSTARAAAFVEAGAITGRPGRRPVLWALIAACGLAVATAGVLGVRSHRAAASSELTRLAVLPFDNQGAPEDEYFADGMTDAVRGKLSALSGLQVTARQSSAEYKHSDKSLREIGRELGVEYLLTATVRWEKQGGANRVQVSPELVQVSTASMRWQQPFDAAMTSVFEVQGQIAGLVAGALDVALGPKEQLALAERPTRNLAAYDDFLRGEEASRSLGVGDAPTLRRAVPFYEAAVARDTTFAVAWARLAVAHAGLYLYGSPTPAEAKAAERALAHAEALAATAPETFVARQSYEGWVRLDWTRALAAAKAGLARYPAHPDLIHAAGLAERSLGRFDAALEHFTRAQQLDPRSLGVVRRRGETLLYLRDWESARPVLDQAHAIDPNDLYKWQLSAMTYLTAGDLDGARRVLARVPPTVDRIALAVNLALYGDMYWALDEQAQDIVLAQPMGAFLNYQVAFTMVRAQLHHLRGDSALTRIWADSALQAVQAQLRAVPDDAQLHVFHGLASAYLGQKATAIAEGERGVVLLPIAKDAFNGTYIQHQLVRIYVLVGEFDNALDQLEPLLKVPYYLSPGWLRIDPTFAPLRGHLRFDRLADGR